jgi:hypothetical protein
MFVMQASTHVREDLRTILEAALRNRTYIPGASFIRFAEDSKGYDGAPYLGFKFISFESAL